MKNKLTKLLLVTIGLALASCCGEAKGATLVYKLDSIQSGATPSGTGPWQTITIWDDIPNYARIEVWNNLQSTTEFVSHVCLNVDPSLDLSKLNIVSSSQYGSGFTWPTVVKAADDIHCDGGGIFDIEIDFDTAQGSRFKDNFWIQFIVNYTGTETFNANSFNFTSDKGDYTLSHIQGIGGNDSSWITTVPEPSAALLGAFGFLGLIRRKRH